MFKCHAMFLGSFSRYISRAEASTFEFSKHFIEWCHLWLTKPKSKLCCVVNTTQTIKWSFKIERKWENLLNNSQKLLLNKVTFSLQRYLKNVLLFYGTNDQTFNFQKFIPALFCGWFDCVRYLCIIFTTRIEKSPVNLGTANRFRIIVIITL